MFRTSTIAGAILAALATLAFGGAQAETTTLKFAAFVPPKSLPVRAIFVPWIKLVEKEAGGDLKIQGFWGGKLGRSPFKQYQLVTKGVTDIGFVLDQYTQGQFPDDSILALPYLIRDPVEGSIARWRMFEKGLLRGYDKIKVVTVYVNDLVSIHTRKPFKSLSDLKGLKIRASGKIGTMYLRQIGAVPTGMAIQKVAEALSHGTLDGVMLNWSGVFTWRTHNVTSHHYVAPLSTYTFIIPMNKGKWNGLSPRAKAAINKYGGEYMARMAGKAYLKGGTKALKKVKASAKHKLVMESAAETARQRAAMQPIYDAWIKKTPGGQKKLDALKKILADIRKGK